MRIEIAPYAHHGNLAIQIWDDDGMPVARPTYNPPYTLPEGYVALATWSENTGMPELLEEAGIVELTDETIQVGQWCHAVIAKLLYE